MFQDKRDYSKVPSEHIETRSGLVPKSINAIPGFGQFAYSTIANAWIMSFGTPDYLDTLENDLTETVLSSDVDDRFSPAAIANATMAIMSDKVAITEHLLKVAPHKPGVVSMIPVKVTPLRAVWEIEHE